jgi:hypothetical protein
VAASVPARSRRSEALVRAAYRRVNELVAGSGGALSEPAGSILSRGRGNRTGLLEALLLELGVKARVALARDFTRDPAPYRFPRPDLAGYAILKVELAGRVYWLDPTNRHTPFGALPGPLRGVEALVLPEPGERVEVARTPVPAEDERRRVRLRVEVGPDGDASVDGSEEFRGFEAAVLRDSLQRLDSQLRRQGAEQALSGSFRSPTLLDLAVDGEGADGPLTIRWRARVERWARSEDGRAVVDAPLFPARLGARFAQGARRELPLLVADDERLGLELSVALPAGWKARPAAPVEVTSPFGHYRRVERVESGRLLREDRYELLRGRVEPGRYPSFAAFAAAVDAAQAEPMVFDRATRGEAKPAVPGR